ncbi:hypothetical protein V5O48_018490 [Marasmius crinis-equi]|uniref:Uncharacterized protein n=1 Tax=Marasmius crinis-equi TaxID=585013 RepID=A0ABR3EL07_9AGAR
MSNTPPTNPAETATGSAQLSNTTSSNQVAQQPQQQYRDTTRASTPTPAREHSPAPTELGSIMMPEDLLYVGQHDSRTKSFKDSIPSYLSLPPLGHREAPKKFRGQSHEVRPFLTHIIRLYQKHNVTNPRDQCQALVTYTSRKVREEIEGTDAFRTYKCKDLLTTLLTLYDAPEPDKCFKLRHLKKLTDEWKSVKIRSLTDFLRYVREFGRISGPLSEVQAITPTQDSEYFFHGIHKSLHKKLNHRL